MKHSFNELQKLKTIAEKSLNKTAELEAVLAQIEANFTSVKIKRN